MRDKLKKFVDDFKKFYANQIGMLIIVSWVVLIICLIIKLFGGNWFELWWENKHFINFCNYVDNNIWLKRVIACLVCLFTTLPALCVFLNEKKLTKKHLLIFIPLIIIKSVLGWFISNITFILDLIILIIIPTLLTKNWKRILLGNVLVFIFQLITILTRNLNAFGLFNSSNTTIENLLIQIDYYLMILLFYLYTFKRKEN